MNPSNTSINSSSSFSAADSPSDSPITVAQMNDMMGHLLQQVLQHQQANIQQQVNAAMESARRQYFPPQQPRPDSPIVSSSSAASAANPSPNFSASVSHSIPPLPPKVKISSPSNFTGALSSNVNSWLFEMDRYLTLCNVTSDDQRIAVASSYLKETASKWWENRCQQLNLPITDWHSFCQAIRERFQPLAAARTARTQLHHLHQGTTSISDYCTKFYNLVQLINDMSEADQVHLFVSSLRSSISREVDMRDPKTLNEAMTLAQKVETLLDNRRHHSHHDSRVSSTSPTYTTTSTSSPAPSSSSGSTSMELGNIYTENEDHSNQIDDYTASEEQEDEYQRYLAEGENFDPNFDIWKDSNQDAEKVEQLQAVQHRSRNTQGRAPFLPREEFTRCMNERLCLRCKQPGHIARNCPLRPPSHRPSQSRFTPKQNFH